MTGPGEIALEIPVAPRLVFTDLPGKTVEEAFAELAKRLAESGVIRDAGELAARLCERERLGSTGLGSRVAIPHMKSKSVADVVVAVATSREGIDFKAADGLPVHVIFLVLSPADAPGLHLQALARISRLLRTPGVADNLRRASAPGDIVETLKEAQTNLAAERR